MPDPSPPVTVARRGAVATVTLNRPEVLNALDNALLGRLADALGELAADDAVRAVVLTGAGRAFSAGSDLSVLPADPTLLRDAVQHVMRDLLAPVCDLLTGFPVPTLAAVNGPCVGGGVGLALATDVVVVRRSAYLLIPQVTTLGIVPDAGATWALPRLAGRARALGMSLLGPRVGGEQAAAWGLVWECVDDERFDGRLIELSDQLAALRPEAVRATRALADAAAGSSLTDQLAAETEAQLALVHSPAARERSEAFRGRARQRAPVHPR